MITQTDVRCAQRIAAVRRFNRFYTQRIGALRERLLDSPFSLTGVRVLYELAHWPARSDSPTAAVLAARLALDEGYLSRILRSFEQRGLVRKQPSAVDGRRKSLALTPRGGREFARLDARSEQEVGTLLGQLSAAQQALLVDAMETVRGLLDATPDRDPAPTVLRPPRPGELGWVIHRHGALYAQEYGYDQRFEALVAQIVSGFVQRFDAARERCWIAERRGQIVGSVFVVRNTKAEAKLRLLLVEPAARGLGIGAQLIDECIGFARAAGYRKLALWTQSELAAARHLYTRAGFQRTGAQKHDSFGRQLVAETWERSL
jgi:DNA-binding MarR family transcriptional regulator/N-acetylglutamate synthase-like GNAT family acetyltransferase